MKKSVKYGLYFVVGLVVGFYCWQVLSYFLLLFRPLTGSGKSIL